MRAAASIIALVSVVFAIAVHGKTNESADLKDHSEDEAKQEMIIHMFNETQRRLHLYEDRVQDWLSSLNDSYFLSNSKSAMKKEIKKKHVEVANEILEAFEADPKSIVVVKLEPTLFGKKEVSAQLLLRKQMVTFMKNMIPKQTEITVMRKKEAEIRKKEDETNDDQKLARLKREEEKIAEERHEFENEIIQANRERFETDKNDFWRELFVNIGQLIDILTKIWKLLRGHFAEIKAFESGMKA